MTKCLRKLLKGGMIWLIVSVLGSVASSPMVRHGIMTGVMVVEHRSSQTDRTLTLTDTLIRVLQ
jgi:hypothetical protein